MNDRTRKPYTIAGLLSTRTPEADDLLMELRETPVLIEVTDRQAFILAAEATNELVAEGWPIRLYKTPDGKTAILTLPWHQFSEEPGYVRTRHGDTPEEETKKERK